MSVGNAVKNVRLANDAEISILVEKWKPGTHKGEKISGWAAVVVKVKVNDAD